MTIVVVTASKYGATREIGEAIADELRASGADAEFAEADAEPQLDKADAVVLGSAVYAGHWLDPARKLLDRNREVLSSRPTWLFSSGPIGDPPKPEGLPAEIERIVAATGAIEHRVFPGRIERRLLGFGERAVVAALRVPDMDSRPRPEIEAWAREIAAALLAPPLPAGRT